MSKFPPAMRFILLPFYGTYLKLRYGLKVERGGELRKILDGPAVVFSNHVHTLDPFFISARFPRHIRWVAGAYLFKMKIPSYLLRHWVMAIPKTQGRSDLETIRSISSALKNGDAVGLFPEGTRSWDGKMMNITEATAKLVRLFKVPTVFINIEGGFSKKPRWSHKERKGKVYLKVKRILMPDEIKASSISDLLGIVKENLTFDNTAWQKENGIEYFDKARQADGIERVMYQCRSRGSYETLSSYRDEVICSHCGKKYKINGYYDAVDESGSVSLASYHDWEKSKLRELVGSDGEILGHGTKGVLFQKGEKGRNVDLSRDFMIHAYPDRISFVFSDGRESSFPYSEIESMIICAKYTVEFYHKGQLYRFRAKGAKSTLKYQDYYSEYIEMNKES